MSTTEDMAAGDAGAKPTEDSGASRPEAQPEELKNLNYEMLLLGLSLLSVLNVAMLFLAQDPMVRNVVGIMDVPMTIIFLVDFLIRLRSAKSKRQYFFRQYGWADLAASLPFAVLKVFRLFRIFRAWRMIAHYGAKNLMRQVSAHRADAALAVIGFLIICVLEFGGIFVTVAERENPDANIKSASDAIWWAFVTITTVGYGDRFPTTNWGRIVGMLVMMTGVGLFGVLTGYLANAFLGPSKAAEEDKQETAQPSQQVDTQAMLDEVKRLISEQEQAQARGQIDSQAMLAEMKRLVSDQEKSQENAQKELRVMVEELRKVKLG